MFETKANTSIMNFQQGKDFGKYQLLEKLAVGGMAELYLGKMIGDEGFEKQIAIKRILPHLNSEQEVVSSFVEEAKLAALLHHPNIVQIYDFGTIDGSYFLAMEYLRGKDLRSIMEKSQEKSLPISFENSLDIVCQVCEGLDYAHSLQDLEGQPLNIIHRDISPQNIFITYHGQVKVIDFGIAKAAGRSPNTRVGVVKGKAAYMSPEQIQGKALDHRSDIFSTGILLYELLTGKRMFEGDYFEILVERSMEDCFGTSAQGKGSLHKLTQNIPIDLPPGVLEIVNRVLAREPEQRYQSAREMADDLENCMNHNSLRPNPHKLALYVKTLFEDEKAEGTSKPSGARVPKISARQKTVTHSVDSQGYDDFNTLAPNTDNFGPGKEKKRNTVALVVNNLICRTRHLQNKKIRNAAILSALIMSLAVLLLLAQHGVGFWSNHFGKEQKIQRLLKQARESLEAGRLTTPVEDCATHYFRQLQNLDPDNQAASQGLYEIGSQYASLAERSIEQFNYRRAEHYIKTGLSVVPEHERLLALKRQVHAPLPGRVVNSIREILN
jgi:serine/threonine protein kinase